MLQNEIYIGSMVQSHTNLTSSASIPTVKANCAALEQRLSQLNRTNYSPTEQADLAKKLVDQFLETTSTNREQLVSLIERVELTTDKQIIIKFCSKQLTGIKFSQAIVYNSRGAMYPAALIVNGGKFGGR